MIATYLSLEGWRKSRITTMESVADYARFHRKRAVGYQWRARTAVILLCVQAAIACVSLTTDLLRARIHLLRFMIGMTVLLAVSVLWLYIFLRVWRRAAAILETNVAEDCATETDREDRVD